MLAHLCNLNYDGDENTFTPEEWATIHFINGLNQVRMPRRLQIYFTTYDVRRAYDTLWLGQGGVVMLHSCEEGPDAHPFWYAQVLAAFVFCVYYDGRKHTMDVLWVQWLGVVLGHRWSIQKARLPKIGFIPESPGAFGCIDPALMIWACHVIPAFAEGCTDSLLRHGHFAHANNDVDNYVAYYVNM